MRFFSVVQCSTYPCRRQLEPSFQTKNMNHINMREYALHFCYMRPQSGISFLDIRYSYVYPSCSHFLANTSMISTITKVSVLESVFNVTNPRKKCDLCNDRSKTLRYICFTFCVKLKIREPSYGTCVSEEVSQ